MAVVYKNHAISRFIIPGTKTQRPNAAFLKLSIRGRDNFFSGVVHPFGCEDIDAGIAQDAAAFFDVRSFKTGDDRDRYSEVFCGSDDTVRPGTVFISTTAKNALLFITLNGAGEYTICKS